MKWSATAFSRLEPATVPTEQEQAEPAPDSAAVGEEFAEDIRTAPGHDLAWYAAYGSLCHTLLEKVELSAISRGQSAEALLAAALAKAAAEYPPDVAAAVSPKRLARVFATPLGKRLLRAAADNAPILREQRFIANLTVAQLQELDKTAWQKLAAATGLDLTRLADEGLFFQGVIDLAFYDRAAGGWVLVDYKSGGNRGLTDEAVAAKYGWQLGLYRHALAAALRQPAAEGYILFTANARAVKMF